MKTQWDYTELADAYLNRPDYAQSAIDEVLKLTEVVARSPVCDVGAGVGHLTLMLAKAGLDVTAVEPNDAMRAHGITRTKELGNVRWHEGTGEDTGQADSQFALVTFGSSFNVTDRAKALIESHRILKPGGWFVCMWNHRDLDDPLQSAVEDLIRGQVSGYGYGARREDQTEVINQSALFAPPSFISGDVSWTLSANEWVNAWRSHATLQRQAGNKFADIITGIEALVHDLAGPSIKVKYTTRIWSAKAI